MSWNLRRERERMSRINLLKKKTQPNLHQTVMMTKRKKMRKRMRKKMRKKMRKRMRKRMRKWYTKKMRNNRNKTTIRND